MWWQTLIPMGLLSVFAVVLFWAERRFPGRQLPEAPGWYGRAIVFNLLDIVILTAVGWIFEDFFRAHALYPVSQWNAPPLEVAFLLMAWSFVFYWWHRAAHLNGLWHVFHQMHHSPSRIEMFTTFYKHPAEAVFETFLTAVVLYLVFGATPLSGAWIGALVAMIGFVSHCNLRTPKWLGYFIQRPEQHSIHHQIDLHKYNYADVIVWDRIFGTFREADTFTERCGFPGDNEKRIKEILAFKDVYH